MIVQKRKSDSIANHFHTNARQALVKMKNKRYDFPNPINIITLSLSPCNLLAIITSHCYFLLLIPLCRSDPAVAWAAFFANFSCNAFASLSIETQFSKPQLKNEDAKFTQLRIFKKRKKRTREPFTPLLRG